MPGAPRSLQQRQQLLNGVLSGGRTPAGAPRPKQPVGAVGGSASKPKQPSSKAGGSSQRRTSGGGGAAAGAAAAAAAAAAYSTGDVVWAKIGNYPWWPAQLQRPVADEHFKPKHAPTDLFCVFYGARCRFVQALRHHLPPLLTTPAHTHTHTRALHPTLGVHILRAGSNDYNWLPATALKPFSETHPGEAACPLLVPMLLLCAAAFRACPPSQRAYLMRSRRCCPHCRLHEARQREEQGAAASNR
jgi:hypothetical protein